MPKLLVISLSATSTKPFQGWQLFRPLEENMNYLVRRERENGAEEFLVFRVKDGQYDFVSSKSKADQFTEEDALAHVASHSEVNRYYVNGGPETEWRQQLPGVYTAIPAL